MLVFKFLDHVVEVSHTDSVEEVNFQEFHHTATKGKQDCKETQGLLARSDI